MANISLKRAAGNWGFIAILCLISSLRCELRFCRQEENCRPPQQ